MQTHHWLLATFLAFVSGGCMTHFNWKVGQKTIGVDLTIPPRNADGSTNQPTLDVTVTSRNNDAGSIDNQ